MTAADPARVRSIVDRVGAYVPVWTRGFFGGTALVHDDVQFAMVMGDTLYLVADELTRPRHEAAGSTPFSYPTGRGPVTVHRYQTLPRQVLDDPSALRTWIDEAIRAARTTPSGGARRRAARRA
jgi:TfoX/Sxy family transcriptional regulator of competence genes